MAGFYKEFMAALHAGLGEEMLTRDSDLLENRKEIKDVCLVAFKQLLNGRKPWDDRVLQGVYGCPASCSGRGY